MPRIAPGPGAMHGHNFRMKRAATGEVQVRAPSDPPSRLDSSVESYASVAEEAGDGSPAVR